MNTMSEQMLGRG